MEKQLYKKFVLISCLFTFVALVTVALFIFGGSSLERVSAIAKENAVKRAKEAQEQAAKRAEEISSSLIIPLPKDIKESDVSVEDIAIDQTLKITIPGNWSTFFQQKWPKGKQQFVEAVYYDTKDSMTQIYIVLNDLCESQMRYANHEIQFSFVPVRELYDKIVVIDAGHGGSATGNSAYGMNEKDITLSISQKLEKMFEQTDIKAYFTRTSDVDLSDEKRAELANKAADAFISIHVNADVATRTTTGICSYYCDEDTLSLQEDDENNRRTTLTNQRLTEMVHKEVIEQTEADDKGVLQQERNELLERIQVPAAMIEVGYVTNRQEAIKMASESYKECVAQGILNAVIETLK